MVMDDESVFCERGLQTVVDELRISTGRTIEHDGNTQEATTADPADAGGAAAEKGKRSEGQAAGVTSRQPSTHSQQQQVPNQCSQTTFASKT